MANETQNKEFNKAIKQLQTMVREKQIINLAEKFYNLKVEMTTLTRNVKEKESSLVLEQAKQVAAKPEPKVEIKAEEPAVVFDTPKQEKQPIKVEQQKQQPQQFSQNKPRNYDNNRNFKNDNRNNIQRNNNQGQYNPNNRNQPQGNGQRNFNQQNGRPYNPNFKPGQNNKPGTNSQRLFNPNYKPGQKPVQNKEGFNKRPAINYAQPVITVTPTRTFANKKKENERFEEKRAYSKRDLLKRGMIVDGDEDRVINRKVKTKKKDVEAAKVEIKPQGPAIITTDNITIKLLSEVSGKPVSEIIKKFMLLGMMVTINSTIDFGTAELILSDMGIELVQKLDKTGRLEELARLVSGATITDKSRELAKELLKN